MKFENYCLNLPSGHLLAIVEDVNTHNLSIEDTQAAFRFLIPGADKSILDLKVLETKDTEIKWENASYAVTLMKLKDYQKKSSSTEENRQTNNSIPNRNIASEIVELFEDLLNAKEIDIPCEDKEEEKIRVEESNARLYGMEYWHLIEAVENLLNGLPCHISTSMGGADATLLYEEGRLIVESEQLNEYLEEYSME